MAVGRRVLPHHQLAVVALALFSSLCLPAGWATAASGKDGAVLCGHYHDTASPIAGQHSAGFIIHSRNILQFSENGAALIAASRDGEVEEVKQLLVEGADIEAKDADGFTPLMWASTNGHREVVEILIDKGADVNATSIQGYSPLSEASFSGHAEVLVILIQAGADINQQDREGWSSLHLAVREGQLTIAKVLLMNGVDIDAQNKLTGATPLTLAAEYGAVHMLQELLDHGANVSATDFNGASGMHYAPASLNWQPVMEALLGADGDINARDNVGDTPLEYAAWVGNHDAIRWLLDRGADPTIADENGTLPWQELCQCEDGDLFELPCVEGACTNATADNEIRLLLGGEPIFDEEKMSENQIPQRELAFHARIKCEEGLEAAERRSESTKLGCLHLCVDAESQRRSKALASNEQCGCVPYENTNALRSTLGLSSKSCDFAAQWMTVWLKECKEGLDKASVPA